MEALDEAGLPDDEPFREAVRSHIEFGTKVAKQNSHAATDTELHPIREVPRWTWRATPTPSAPPSSSSVRPSRREVTSDAATSR
jgi:hemoglobin